MNFFLTRTWIQHCFFFLKCSKNFTIDKDSYWNVKISIIHLTFFLWIFDKHCLFKGLSKWQTCTEVHQLWWLTKLLRKILYSATLEKWNHCFSHMRPTPKSVNNTYILLFDKRHISLPTLYIGETNTSLTLITLIN